MASKSFNTWSCLWNLRVGCCILKTRQESSQFCFLNETFEHKVLGVVYSSSLHRTVCQATVSASPLFLLKYIPEKTVCRFLPGINRVSVFALGFRQVLLQAAHVARTWVQGRSWCARPRGAPAGCCPPAAPLRGPRQLPVLAARTPVRSCVLPQPEGRWGPLGEGGQSPACGEGDASSV